MFDELFAEVPVMGIMRGMGAERTLEVSRLAWSAGIQTVEVPLQTVADADALAQLAEAAALEGRIVGAGTVITAQGVADAAAAGARYTVSPGWDADIARASLDAGLAHLPGVATGSDIQAALKFGLGWVKAFPAAQLGSGWISAMRGPFPTLRFVATGGINASNAGEFLEAGASAVAIGAAIADADVLAKVRELRRG